MRRCHMHSYPPPRTGRDKARLWLSLCLLVALAVPAFAQDNYPSHPVTLIAPYAAGGSMDLVSRIVAEGLTARLGQSDLVDVKPGGNGVIGIREALKAPPDGYTLLLGSVGANVTPSLMQPNYPFDPLRDYVPVAMVAEWSAILVVKKDLPVNTLAEFIAYAKARPGALNFGATGYGSFAHLVGEVFMQRTGISMQHIQYKGGSQSTTDLLSATGCHLHELGGRRGPGRQSATEDAGGCEQDVGLGLRPICRPWRRQARPASIRCRGRRCSASPRCRSRSATGSHAKCSRW